MKRMAFYIVPLLTALCCAACNVNVGQKSILIPKPAEVIYQSGSLKVEGDWALSIDAPAEMAASLTDYLEMTPIRCIKEERKDLKNYLHLILSDDVALPKSEEGYCLTVDEKGVTIISRGEAGLFYGLQTLQQLYAQNDGRIAAQKITDMPRFEYRGQHLDVSRHFFSKEFVMKQMRMMALLKLNRLHLHLTDAAGWRLEIDRYPGLTDIAAWRIGKTWEEWQKAGNLYCPKDDPRAEGGYYTKDDIREMLAYAGKLHITVIPEIEFPAHSDEVMAVYPELSCAGGAAPHTGGDLCIGNEKTFEFVENVLLEVMELFPSEYIHIGGDEAGKDAWKECPECKARMKAEGLASVDELQSYAIRRIGRFLNEHGRKLIGWDEILDGGLAPGAIVMSWRGEEGGRKAAAAGHEVIMTPGSYCYFNRYQDSPEKEPEAMGGIVILPKVYSYDPAPQGMEGREYVIGVQGDLWTEFVPTPEHAEYMLYPRLFALSEVAWSELLKRDYNDFRRRALWLCGEARKMGYNTFDLSTEVGERPESLHKSRHKAVGRSVKYVNRWHENYPAGREEALTDGIHGSWSYFDRWQGFLCCDADVTIDLGKVRTVHEVMADFIQWRSVEIWVPEKVEIGLSNDGKNFRTVSIIEHHVDTEERRPLYMTFGWDGEEKARYVRYHAYINRNVMGWLFTDEIEVN